MSQMNTKEIFHNTAYSVQLQITPFNESQLNPAFDSDSDPFNFAHTPFNILLWKALNKYHFLISILVFNFSHIFWKLVNFTVFLIFNQFEAQSKKYFDPIMIYFKEHSFNILEFPNVADLNLLCSGLQINIIGQVVVTRFKAFKTQKDIVVF